MKNFVLNRTLAEGRQLLDSGKLRAAFTLSEVLITLAVIGIVAALTIPNLINKYTEQQTVVGLKKFYSMLSQAYLLCITENGSPDRWIDSSWNNTTWHGTKAQIVIDKLIPYLKIDKKCAKQGSYCYGNIIYKYFDGSERGKIDTFSAWVATKLADGMYIVISGESLDTTCSKTSGNIKDICGHIMVDINGSGKPNQFGHDFHHFYFTKTGIVPMGNASEEDKPCTTTGTYHSCTDWIIKNNNMDYIHCDDLSWSGKRKCAN